MILDDDKPQKPRGALEGRFMIVGIILLVIVGVATSILYFPSSSRLNGNKEGQATAPQ